MLITLRMPRASAQRLGLDLEGDAAEEVAVSLPSIELAGRLSIATAKVVSPRALARYCASWHAAGMAAEALLCTHGADKLDGPLRASCNARGVWLPDRGGGLVDWLQCVVAAKLLAMDRAIPRADLVQIWACMQGIEELAANCELHFAGAYQLWTIHHELMAATDRGL